MDTTDWLQLASLYERLECLDAGPRAELLEQIESEQPKLAAELSALISRGDEDADQLAAQLATSLAEAVGDGPLAPGERFGAYEIEELLGVGGMGAVYLARRSDGQFDKQVAIKLLPSRLAGSIDRERFASERKLLARLEHPAIARIIDAGISDAGQPFYALDYVQGQTADLFAKTATPHQVLEAFIVMCDAVAHAHAQLVVHCDIKPANVLVTDDGEVKLVDFGIARQIGDADLSIAASGSGTPLTRDYAAPELIAGDEVDTRTDVYSLGVLLYELLAGEKPYTLPYGARDEVLGALEAAKPTPLADRSPLAAFSAIAREELGHLCARAMCFDRDHRLSSAWELADEARRIVAGEPLVHPPEVRGYRLRKATRRNPAAAILAVSSALATLAVVAVLAVLLVSQRAANKRVEEEKNEAERQRATADAVTEFLLSIFDAADPDVRKATPGAFSATELVESAIARRAHDEVSDRRIADRLDVVIGQIASKLGLFERAKPLLGGALERGLDPALEKQALLALGISEAEAGEMDAGFDTLSRAVAVCERAGDIPCQIEALTVRAEVELDSNKPADAKKTILLALERAEDAKLDGEIANLNYGLGIAMHKLGEESTGQFDKAAELFRGLTDEVSFDAAFANLQIGVILHHRRKHDDALSHLTKARDLFLRLVGPNHVRVAYVDFIPDTYSELGDLDKALTAARNSTDVRRSSLGEEHGDTGMAWGRVATVLSRQGKDDEALAAAKRSRAITKTTKPMSHAKIGLGMARVFIKKGEHERALELAKESLSFYEKRFSPKHSFTVQAHAVISDVHAAAGRSIEALASQRRAVEIAESSLRSGHPTIAAERTRLAKLEGF